MCIEIEDVIYTLKVKYKIVTTEFITFHIQGLHKNKFLYYKIFWNDLI